MLSKKIGRVALCLFVVLFVIGCTQMSKEIVDGTDNGMDDDDTVSVTPGDLPDDDTNMVGTVVLLTGDDEMDQDAIDQAGGDTYTFNSAIIEGDTLTVSVSYGGGCETHEFTLFAEPELFPPLAGGLPMLGISIAHNANGDMCERWVTESYDFDLTPIKNKYQEELGMQGAILLSIIADPTVTPPEDGFPDNLTYSFAE